MKHPFHAVTLTGVAVSALLVLLLQGAASSRRVSAAAPTTAQARPCLPTHADAPEMVDIPAGSVLFGEDGPGRPGRTVAVAAFRIDRTEVSNRQFAAFVHATGYVTQAEREGRSAVFVLPKTLPRGLDDASQWWAMQAGVNWHHPHGPGSDLTGAMDNPVVHVSYDDAAAYARWRGHALPTEAQWERAARGHQTAAKTASSWAYSADGKPIANTWQGVFPLRDTAEDGFDGIAPVGCFAPNDFGLYDMIGNVWEWTLSEPQSEPQSKPLSQPQGSTQTPGQRLIKGGSYLCAFNYCANFRAAAWQVQEANLPTSHVGFRTVGPALPK